MLEFLGLTKIKLQCSSSFVLSQSVLIAQNLEGSAFLSLNTEKIEGRRRGDIWAIQFLAKSSLESSNLMINLVSKSKSSKEPTHAKTETSVSRYCLLCRLNTKSMVFEMFASNFSILQDRIQPVKNKKSVRSMFRSFKMRSEFQFFF